MSDPDDLPDAVDQAYARAEALLDDACARAARRARLLTAVAAETSDTSATPSPPRRWATGRGRWLAAASVAGLGFLVATQIYRPDDFHPPSAEPAASQPSTPAITAAQSPPAGAAATGVPPTIKTPSPQMPPRRSSAVQTHDSLSGAGSVDSAPAPAVPAPLTPPRDHAEASTPNASQKVEELVVTGSRIPAPARAAAPQAVSTDAAARLRSAATAGRLKVVADLLARGAPVDAQDDDGETALMKAVKSGRADVVALLRRKGANPELPNHAGRTAREMAAEIADPDLEKALDPGS
jgi:hypothetical protein